MNEAVAVDSAYPERLRVPLRAADFELLTDAGAFADYGKTELIDGEIYYVNAQWARHARVKSRLHIALAGALATIGSHLEALVEASVRVADSSMPEPDVVLTTWRGDRAVPAETVALVIEISDTTLGFDLGRKADLYAAAGIPEYWVVDLSEDRVLMHEFPSADGYEGQLDIPIGELLVAATITGLKVRTDRLLD